ncbi:unnamed protein product [Orchesella dallaii]|uniref:Uncharacterized protein n=1 Tax=Orchesella dallaii TaxID=48710 RepID=A0ABP1PVG1_9HEXA
MEPIQQKSAKTKPAVIKGEEKFLDSVDIFLVTHRQLSLKKISNQQKKVNVVYFNPPLQKNNACFFNWMLEDHPFTLEETDLLVTKEKVESLVDKRLTRHLKLRPLGTIADHLVLAFCHLVSQDIANAGRELGLSFDLIVTAKDKKYMTKEQGHGISHVYFGLVAMTEQLMMEVGIDKSWHNTNLTHYIETCIQENAPHSYPACARATIQFVKGAFMGSRRFWHERIYLLEKVAEVESENIEVWIALFNSYRQTRKSGEFFDPYPSLNEEFVLIEAWKLDRCNPLVKLSISIYLSDILRSWKHKFQQDVGWVILNSVDENGNVLKSKIWNNCFNSSLADSEDMKESVRDNVSIGDIVMTGLPQYYQDCILAKKCFEATLLLNPNCSSASHKLGLLKLKLRNPIESVLPHFQKAFKVDPRNYPSLIYSIKLMMRKPKEREEELMNLFREVLTEGMWSDAQLLSLRLLKGLLLYMLGAKNKAMPILIEALRLNHRKAMEILNKIPYLTDRYGWDAKMLNVQSLLKLLSVDETRIYRNGYRRDIVGGTSTQHNAWNGSLSYTCIIGRKSDQNDQRGSDYEEKLDKRQLGTCNKENRDVCKKGSTRENGRSRNSRGRDRASASNIGKGGYEFKYF